MLRLKADLILQDKYWQFVRLFSSTINGEFYLLNVYGPTSTAQKRDVWQGLSNIIQDYRDKVLIIGGDFNAMLEAADKKGGRSMFRTVQAHFQNFVTRNGLLEVKHSNGAFTWTNHRQGFLNIAEKLDRFFLAGN